MKNQKQSVAVKPIRTTAPRVPYTVVKDSILQLLEERGVEPRDGEATAQVLLEAEARGYPTQGVGRIFEICEFLDRKLLNPRISWEVRIPCPSARVFTSKASLGHPIAVAAIDKAAELAQSHGMGCTAVLGSGHIGYLTYYAERAAMRGMLAIVTTTSSPAVVAPDSSVPIFGTNPVAFAFRYGNDVFCADFSLAEVSRGEVLRHRGEHTHFQRPVGVDSAGAPSCDPQRILEGGISAVGATWKGAFMNLLFGILAGPLIGGVANHMVNGTRWATDVPSKGDFFLCININAFCERARFDHDVEEFLCHLGTLSSSFHVPGRHSRMRLVNVLKDGFEITADVQRLLDAARQRQPEPYRAAAAAGAMAITAHSSSPATISALPLTTASQVSDPAV